MRGNRRRDTKPELAIRRRVHGAGLRYRVDYPPIAGFRRRADLVFSRARVAVFVDGCYWHGCPVHGTGSKTNSEFWSEKIARNRERDDDTNRRLRESGWTVLRFWEHDDPAAAAAVIVDAVRATSS